MSAELLPAPETEREVAVWQTGWHFGVAEGVRIGRQELAAEQLAAQRAEHERLGIDDLITGHINYVRTVPQWRRDELAGRGTRSNLRAA